MLLKVNCRVKASTPLSGISQGTWRGLAW